MYRIVYVVVKLYLTCFNIAFQRCGTVISQTVYLLMYLRTFRSTVGIVNITLCIATADSNEPAVRYRSGTAYHGNKQYFQSDHSHTHNKHKVRSYKAIFSSWLQLHKNLVKYLLVNIAPYIDVFTTVSISSTPCRTVLQQCFFNRAGKQQWTFTPKNRQIKRNKIQCKIGIKRPI